MCVCDVQTWCSSRRLQLNLDKIKLIRFGSHENLECLLTTSCWSNAHPADWVRDLGIILDSSLSICQHIAKVTSTCFFHLQRLRKIGTVVDRDSRNHVVCALILTHIDYCNVLFAGLPDSTLAPLHHVLHTAARFVSDLRPQITSRQHISTFTGYQFINISHTNCAAWCMELSTDMLQNT